MKPVYLDNAATSFPKPRCVTDALLECVSKYCGNPGRSSHALAEKSAEMIFQARENIADLLGVTSPERVIFTPGATSALNYAIKGLIDHKCHVIISDAEHNSVLRPIYALEERLGVSYSVYNSSLPIKEAIEPLIREDTEFIVTTLASNLFGNVIDVEGLSALARERGLRVIADASQYIGHRPLDLSLSPLDVLCAPGHKALFGIQGVGFFLLGEGVMPRPIIEGGSGAESFSRGMPSYLPERFEAGTLPTPAVVSLSRGVKFLLDYGPMRAEARISALTDALTERLISLPRLRLLSAGNGIAAFNLGNYGSEAVADMLAKRGICVRGGFHCAPSAHIKLDSKERGAVRVSLSILNKERELDALWRALCEIEQKA